MKKIRIVLATFLFIILSTFTSHADSIEKMNFDVIVDKEGNATITETWHTTFNEGDEGTERYKTFYDLQDEVEVISVKQDGEELTETDWNVGLPFEKKVGKYGILKKSDGFELCWGIGKYGPTTYEVKYKVHSFIRNLKDSDIAYWSFIGNEFEPKPEEITIGIKLPDSNIVPKMWAFGYDGIIDYDEQRIYQKSAGRINAIRTLLKFPKGTFNSKVKEDKPFAYYEKMAKRGSDYNTYLLKDIVLPIIKKLLIPLIVLGQAIGTIILREIKHRDISNIREMKKRVKQVDKDDFRSSLPYEGPIEDTVLTVSYKYNIRKRIPSVLIARLVLKEYLSVNNDTITINKTKDKEHLPPYERIFLYTIENIMGDYSTITLDDLSQGLSKKENAEKVIKIIELVEDYSEEFLLQNNLLTKEKEKLSYTEKAFTFGQEMFKFKNYLENFTLMKERHLPDVHLWEEWLEYAYLFDIPEETIQAIMEYVPNNTISPNVMYSINSISSATNSGLSDYRSSGGGGRVSFGGGSGASGGGGGGTR